MSQCDGLGSCRAGTSLSCAPYRCGGANQCKSYTGALESPTITAYSALQQMASNIETFYNQPNPGDLTRIYTEIAAEIGGTRIIPDDTL